MRTNQQRATLQAKFPFFRWRTVRSSSRHSCFVTTSKIHMSLVSGEHQTFATWKANVLETSRMQSEPNMGSVTWTRILGSGQSDTRVCWRKSSWLVLVYKCEQKCRLLSGSKDKLIVESAFHEQHLIIASELTSNSDGDGCFGVSSPLSSFPIRGYHQ